MKKFLIILLCILAIASCWYYLILDEKERILWNISSDKVDHLYSFDVFPIEFDEYKVFLASDKSNEELGDLLIIDEEWTKEDNDLSIEVKLYSNFYEKSPQTFFYNAMEQDDYYKRYFEELGMVNVLNQKGYYKSVEYDNTYENPKEITYYSNEILCFDLDGISYIFTILRKSTSNSIEPFGANKLIDMFFTNNFKK